MPELPEVQTVVDDLQRLLVSKQITNIEPLTHRVFRNQDLIQSILDRPINRVSRRGKYIIIHFDETDLKLIAHLRMTGKFVSKCTDSDNPYIRCIITLNSTDFLYFVDVRQFGGFDISSSLSEYFAKLGVEPLSADFDQNYLIPLLKRDQPIKSFLMDQQYIAGLGNIYADESLFLAGIHPTRPSRSLNKQEVGMLVTEIQNVLKSAIHNMGTTLSDYRNTDNVAGDNQNYLFVYGRKDKPCKKCKTHIVKIKMGGRGTHYCPTCQKT